MTKAPPVATALLTIGPDETKVLGLAGDGSETVETLALGSRNTSASHFRHDLPTPLELENAINAVEDELMRAPRTLASATRLATRDVAVAALADAAGIVGASPREMTLDMVEDLFQRLASASLGKPGAARGLPEGREAAALLLILREFMHHRGFAAITVLEPKPTA
jgi:hypothetical protein